MQKYKIDRLRKQIKRYAEVQNMKRYEKMNMTGRIKDRK